ncbi:testis-specific gene A8 protein-like isoform X6 [Melanerpes formicivorus]|uniref:testis-specific gene A8 protein-like isoform X6 n=1 Tax=Melanerpes formicivorus TaxID=211600 RepID=UPI00358F3988
MDRQVSLTWLLLLSAALLSQPASGAWWSSPGGAERVGDLWSKFTDWIKGKFDSKEAPQTSAPASTLPADTTVVTPTTAAPTSADQEPTTAEPTTAASTTAEPTTAALSSSTAESKTSSAPGPAPEEVAAPESTTATAENPRAASEPPAVTCKAPAESGSPAPPTGDEAASAPEVTSTAAEGPAPAESTPEPGVPAESRTAEPAETDPPAPEPAGATAGPAPAESTPEPGVTSSPATTASPAPKAAATATTHAGREQAPKDTGSQASLPPYMQLTLQKYLSGLCQPRRPGMQSVQLERCVKDPTCGKYYVAGGRVIHFKYPGALYPRACLRCEVLACDTARAPSPQHYPYRGRRSAQGKLILIISPQ